MNPECRGQNHYRWTPIEAEIEVDEKYVPKPDPGPSPDEISETVRDLEKVLEELS